MASSFQQKARQRKVVYLVLILALFTGSLLHRRLVVERQAENLQLREISRGEVELTSSAVRLALTGSRGLATTLLWYTALDKMAKHEWNELELLVGSITKLQPYFITPWLFQSWNMAFNVSVECDQPKDKYYYVSRGLELLAEGERRNQGTTEDTAGRPKFPGHPELRHHMGFTYQLKIGNSDEKNTMRCLLDMSCIDPLKRNPDKFRTVNERGQEVVVAEEFMRFCQEHPRLVRRLREQLGYNAPKDVVKFLAQNRDVPSRFKPTATADQRDSELEIPRRQFPILPPPPAREGRPDPTTRTMTQESIDVFLICRTWYQYAQEPLPPPNPDPGVPEKEAEWAIKYDKVRFRLPKAMATQIFRGYPGRAQVFIAENLEAEGWFDEEGWLVREWFDQGPAGADQADFPIGTEPKYHAAPAWQRGYEMYRDFGIQNGMYLSAADEAELNRKAQAARTALKIEPTQLDNLRPEQRPTLGESYDAHLKLYWSRHYRTLTNYDAHLYQSEGERHPETVLARKLVFDAEMLRKTNDFQALQVFEQAWPAWVHALLSHPAMARIGTVQDELYEPHLRYLRLSQEAHKDTVFRPVLLAMAQFRAWPHPSWEEWGWITSGQRAKVTPVRSVKGSLDTVLAYDGPQTEEVRRFWFGVTYGAMLATRPGFVVPAPMPGAENYSLAGYAFRGEAPAPTGFRYLVDDETVRQVRDRLGLNR